MLESHGSNVTCPRVFSNLEMSLKEHDNAQLRQIMADLTLDNQNLRDVNQKSGEAVGVPSNGGFS